MLTHFKSILRDIFFIGITVSLVACGGGGDSLPSRDSSAPTVISTSPSSEAEGIRRGTDIVVTFSENISAARNSNIEIYPVVSGKADKTVIVEFQLINSPDSFIIVPKTGALSINTIYQVTIIGIKDSAENPMV